IGARVPGPRPWQMADGGGDQRLLVPPAQENHRQHLHPRRTRRPAPLSTDGIRAGQAGEENRLGRVRASESARCATSNSSVTPLTCSMQDLAEKQPGPLALRTAEKLDRRILL